MDYEKELRKVMLAQQGLITLAQAISIGMTEVMIRHRLATKRWIKVFRGVYRHADVKPSWEQKLLAAQLCLGESAVISHRSAARLYGLRGTASELIEFTTASGQRSNYRGIVIHRTKHLFRADIKGRRGYRATSVERTLWDLATVVTPKSSAAALDSALGQGLTTIRRVAAMASVLKGKGRRGSGAFAGLVEERLHGLTATDSDLELDFLDLCRRYRIPKPQTQRIVRDSQGRIGRIDFVYPAARLLIEVDGYEWHADLEPFREDRRRDRRAQGQGWRVLRYTYWDIHDEPAESAAEILSFLYPRLALVDANR